MMTKRVKRLGVLLATALVLAGCSATTGSGSSTAVASTAPVSSTVSTARPDPASAAPANATLPNTVPTAQPAPTNAPIGPGAEPAYLDDRSGAEALIDSFYNAINRHEYGRAYNYWEPDVANLPPYQSFVQGYNTTTSVQVNYGPITGDVGAGQYHYNVPVALTSNANGSAEYFAGCYTLHLASPAAQATQPFQPLAIESANIQRSDTLVDASTLAQVCQNSGSPVTTSAESGSIDAANYLDNRSDPVAVLRSFYNAINRHEYLRAYSYWQDQSQLPGPDAFAQGYSTTTSVTLTTGDVQSDAGAGQYNYSGPVTVLAQMNDGSTQTYAGCYRLHLANPHIQEESFQSLGITSAMIQQVTGNTSATELMNQSCQANP